jgi:hypothetical protein
MSGPLIAPKPRPWSMVNSEAKSADLLSDGSSPINSTGNTPDSADTLDSSESSLEKRVTKDVKLKRGGESQRTDPSRSLVAYILLFYFFLCCTPYAFLVFVRKAFWNAATPSSCSATRYISFFYLFLFSHVAPHLWNCRLDGDRFQATSDKPGRPSDDVVRRRDSNYNCSETEDAHISR